MTKAAIPQIGNRKLKTPNAIPTNFTFVTLSRGIDAARIEAHDKNIVIFTSSDTIHARPIRGAWLQLDLEGQRSILFQGSKPAIISKMKDIGPFTQVNNEIVTALGLCSIVSLNTEGFSSGQDVNAKLDKYFGASPTLLAGSLCWSGRKFYSSPMGHRVGCDSWTHFVAAGGQFSFDIPWPPHPNQAGYSLACMSKEDLWGRPLFTAVDLMRQRFPSPYSHIYCNGKSIDDAAVLAILRMAWGRVSVVVELADTSAPGWKRLVQHLGFTPTKSTLMSKDSADLATFREGLPSLDTAGLIRDINSHSQVIPESILQA